MHVGDALLHQKETSQKFSQPILKSSVGTRPCDQVIKWLHDSAMLFCQTNHLWFSLVCLDVKKKIRLQ